jgi:hypothetical protein
MRDPLRTRCWMPGRLPAVLLALALAACGGGDDGGGGEAVAGDSAQTETQSAQVAAADSTCTPPPVPSPAVLTGKWQDLVTWINTNNVTFPTTPQNVAVDTVPLCPGCKGVGVRLQSTSSTYCITPQNVPEQRIAGMMVLLDTFPEQGGFQTIPAGDTIFMFSRGTPGASHHATLVYRHGTDTRHAPAKSWKFFYCQDGHVNTAPAAQWRPEDPAGAGAEKGKGKGRDDDGEGPGGTYGWMACANGCCQFYTPPPNAEETEGGSGGPPPPWCKTN